MNNYQLNRDNVKLLASGKYIALKKSYDQQEHENFIDGAMFCYDLMQQIERDNERARIERTETKKD